MKPYLLHIYFMISISIFSCQTTRDNDIIKVVPEEFNMFLKDKTVQLIDVRTPKEFEIEHIKNAENINILDEDFSKKINKLNKDQPVYIYCRSGKRSAKSAAEFKKAGFNKVYELEGGLLNWKSYELSVTKEL